MAKKEEEKEKPKQVTEEKRAKEENKQERKQEEKTIKKKNKKEEKIEKKENEQEQEENQALTINKEIEIDEVKLEKIEAEIKKQTTITEEKQKKINKKIFQNILLAVVIVAYFIFLNLGFYNIKADVFLRDLQVFSLITIGITIILFEKAYQKENGELAIHGIEMLALAICTLISINSKTNQQEKFVYLMNMISMLFAIYYVAKSIIIYCKMRKKALKQASDIHKIGRVKE